MRLTGELDHSQHMADPEKFHLYAEKSPTNRRNAAHDGRAKLRGDNHGENV